MNISRSDIFNVEFPKDFHELAMQVFNFQVREVLVYQQFLAYLKLDPSTVRKIEDIPFIPIEFFKYHKIIARGLVPEVEFTSSGTSGMVPGKHLLASTQLYEMSFMKSFVSFYGPVEDYCILALLPSYLERGGSSLVYMVDFLIKQTNSPESGFYLDNLQDLMEAIYRVKKQKRKILLLGVSFALLDLAEKFSPDLSGHIVMETGGMKGMRKEIPREELHAVLKEKFRIETIHSEYGMTELLSQAYSYSDGIFNSPPWMKILIRDPYDPFSFLSEGKSGAVNIIDLANLYSCSFIASSDLGRIIPGKGFEILGRMDSSDIRGCNLLIAME
jgi:phenylacetate-coenzyme A ligase PaaK-like adenylate-forming protein